MRLLIVYMWIYNKIISIVQRDHVQSMHSTSISIQNICQKWHLCNYFWKHFPHVGISSIGKQVKCGCHCFHAVRHLASSVLYPKRFAIIENVEMKEHFMFQSVNVTFLRLWPPQFRKFEKKVGIFRSYSLKKCKQLKLNGDSIEEKSFGMVRIDFIWKHWYLH